MSQEKQFIDGCKVIAELYSKRINDKPFNEVVVEVAVNSLRRIGFRLDKKAGSGQAVTLYNVKGEYVQRVVIGKQGENGFFHHDVAHQPSFIFA